MPLTALATQNSGTPAPSAWANLIKANFDVLIAAWTAYTPTLTNATLGNGTITGRYLQMGKTVVFEATFTLGSTSTVGTRPTISAPVIAAATTYPVPGQAFDSSANAIYAIIGSVPASGTAVRLGSGSGDITASVPFVWATSDNIVLSGVYEAG